VTEHFGSEPPTAAHRAVAAWSGHACFIRGAESAHLGTTYRDPRKMDAPRQRLDFSRLPEGQDALRQVSCSVLLITGFPGSGKPSATGGGSMSRVLHISRLEHNPAFNKQSI